MLLQDGLAPADYTELRGTSDADTLIHDAQTLNAYGEVKGVPNLIVKY